MTLEKLLTREDVAQTFGIKISTLRTWERKGKLRPLRLSGGTVRYCAAQVEEFLKSAGR